MGRVLPQARSGTRARPRATGLTVTPELLQGFLDHMQELGRAEETIYTYRGHLERIYERLGENHTIYPGTLDQIGQQMVQDGYSPNTVNVSFAAANSFLEYCGRRDLQVNKLEKVYEVQPELTRNEYFRILMTAKQLGKERDYLLVKLLATTGINISELHKVTVQAVQDGAIAVAGIAGEKALLRLSNGLQKELLAYIEENALVDGPVFVTRTGKIMERSNVNARVSALARDAQVDESKCTPRCLQRLYKDTMTGIRDTFEIMVQQTYLQMLDNEQLQIGWKD